MIISNEYLQEAYKMIREIYRHKALVPAKLRKIGYRNKWNYVLTDGVQTGLAFNFTADHAVYGQFDDLKQFFDLQPYIGRSLFEFIEYLLLRPEIQMNSLCLAALNALSNPLTSLASLRERGIPVSEDEKVDYFRKEDVVTVIGYGGLINQLYGRCKEFHICDMRPMHALCTLTIGEEIEYGPEKIIFHSGEKNNEIISQSDVVIMSGCTLVNGTFAEIVRNAKIARIIGMYGPSAQIIPDFLLSYGINYISSCRITNHSGIEYQLKNALDLQSAIKSDMQAYFIEIF